MAATKISLKLFIDKKSEIVLFAEASKEFVDFLFNVFTLPFGNITRILKDKGMGGCLPSLFNSIENLSDAYFLPDQPKEFVLNPVVAVPGPKVPLLLPQVESYKSRESSRFCGSCGNFQIEEKLNYNTRLCASCSTASVTTRFPEGFASPSSSSDEGYVKGMVIYMVMDDLEVKPMVNISFVTLLTQFNIQDVGNIEEKVVQLGINEGVKLLKASLRSKTVLTDVFLRAENLATEVSIKDEGV
ncbi:uncharacterized protein LOC132188449 [Corylus avellana]|uniref:uncharacterized protein LOC132188449 n=1 Tax=Corylus avellana TaxID=13451 RepID=UPI002869F9A6|nr:uncharacterized protein LOC132188449 [Corylus avellana]